MAKIIFFKILILSVLKNRNLGIHGIKTRNSVNSDNKCLYVKIYEGSFAFKKVKVFWVRRYLNHFLKSIGQLQGKMEKEDIVNSFELQIENEKFKVENETFVANENCNTIFVSFIYDRRKNEPHFIFELTITKKGVLRKISYTRFGESTKPFDTADFNLKGLISINNFVYDESRKYLNFDFNGEILEVESNIPSLDQPQKRKRIIGKINVNKISNTPCTSFISDLNFKTNNLTFGTNYHAGSYDPDLKVNPYNFRFYSDNGYRAIIKSKVDLWILDKGTYTFD